MQKINLIIAVLILGTASLNAQTVATFDDLTLPSLDTYYVNLTAYGSDVGFNDGLAHFPCVYDTSFGYTLWNYFAYSNRTDSVTSGYTNQYSAKTGAGYGGSAKYAVVYCSNPTTYENKVNVKLIGAAVGKSVDGFYATNSTYAYNAMSAAYPLASPARKFHNGDWFRLTIKGYSSGVLSSDSVNYFLADYRFTDTTLNYISKTWQWVNLLPLGHVDSLQFSLNSSDTGMYGMNTPAYFCIDNFTTNETSVSVPNVAITSPVKVYPNPAKDMLFIETNRNSIDAISIMDVEGNVVYQEAVSIKNISVNLQNFASGIYVLHLSGNGKEGICKFIKQ